MITSTLRITGLMGGTVEYSTDGNDGKQDKQQVYEMLFKAIRNFVEVNTDQVLNHNSFYKRMTSVCNTIEDWNKIVKECELDPPCTTDQLCGEHQRMSELINIGTLPSESV